MRIEIDESGGGDRAARLREVFGPDPRVRIASARSSLDEFPAAAFHVTMPATVSARDLAHRLHAKMGGAVLAVSPLPDGTSVLIARSWALHRARRADAEPADFGEVREIAPAKLKLKTSAAGKRAAAADAMGIPFRWKYLRERARDIHSLREAWWFVCCLLRRRRRLLPEEAQRKNESIPAAAQQAGSAGNRQWRKAVSDEAPR